MVLQPPSFDTMRRQFRARLAGTREQLAEGVEKTFELRRFAGPMAHADALRRPIRVAHLTDLHVGLVTPAKVLMTAVDMVNQEQPDLVVITGDFVCYSQVYLEALPGVVSAFDAPTVGVLGNHDHWVGADAVRETLRRAGMKILDNANTVIELGKRRLQLVGLDDAFTGHADSTKALEGMRRNIPTLGLSHIAEEADALWAAGVPLVLSGHTHAGHVALGRLHELTLGRMAGHRYVHGLYGTRTGAPPRGAVYVGAGVGATIVPMRLGDRARREVTIFELGAVPGSIEEHHGEQLGLKGRLPSERTLQKREERVHKYAARRLRRQKARAARRDHKATGQS